MRRWHKELPLMLRRWRDELRKHGLDPAPCLHAYRNGGSAQNGDPLASRLEGDRTLPDLAGLRLDVRYHGHHFRLIFAGLFDRHPRLRLVAHHGGGCGHSNVRLAAQCRLRGCNSSELRASSSGPRRPSMPRAVPISSRLPSRTSKVRHRTRPRAPRSSRATRARFSGSTDRPLRAGVLWAMSCHPSVLAQPTCRTTRSMPAAESPAAIVGPYRRSG